MPKILLTGGSGKLGTELQKLRQFDYVPTHDELDVTIPASIAAYAKDKVIDLIVHAAAYTDTAKAQEERELCLAINVDSIEKLKGIIAAPLLYISSEYAILDSSNIYGYSKRLGEERADKSLRLLFKPTPWPYETALYDQWTSGDYVDVIAKEVNLAIELYDKLPVITSIGTGRKSIYHLAKRTRPDVFPASRDTIKGREIPTDTAMDMSEWEALKEDYAKNRRTQTNS